MNRALHRRLERLSGRDSAGRMIVLRIAADRTEATNALREEAERSWTVSDEKAAKGRRRTQARAKRQGEARGPEAELHS